MEREREKETKCNCRCYCQVLRRVYLIFLSSPWDQENVDDFARESKKEFLRRFTSREFLFSHLRLVGGLRPTPEVYAPVGVRGPRPGVLGRVPVLLRGRGQQQVLVGVLGRVREGPGGRGHGGGGGGGGVGVEGLIRMGRDGQAAAASENV